MEFSVTIEGLDRIGRASQRVRDEIAKEINKAVFLSGKKVEGDAKRSILSGQKSGRIYTRRTVAHQASAPGEAPASDTGRLVNSINTERSGPGEAKVIAGRGIARYAALLEFGTRLMAARPFFFPAFEKNREWIRERLSKAVRDVVVRVGK
jgi:HK97 gp10 family phage protein